MAVYGGLFGIPTRSGLSASVSLQQLSCIASQAAFAPGDFLCSDIKIVAVRQDIASAGVMQCKPGSICTRYLAVLKHQKIAHGQDIASATEWI